MAYGVVLTTARALGEIGAVLVVSSNVAGSTLTLPLLIYQRDEQVGGQVTTSVYAAATELAVHVARRVAVDDDVRLEDKGRAMRIEVRTNLQAVR